MPPDGLQRGRLDASTLAARIRAEFPTLSFAHTRLDDAGDDHAALILDEAWVFRFPRTAAVAAHDVHQRSLLQRLNPLSPVPTPDPIFVSAANEFAGYRMLPGRPLEGAVFEMLRPEAKAQCLKQLGSFLACLHGLPASLGAGGPQAWSGAQYVARYRRRRTRLCSAAPSDLLASMDRFYVAFPDAVDRAGRTLIHGDLSTDHILIAPEEDGLSGIIDFTDATVGDPAFDFTCFWDYGDDAPAAVAGSYGRSRLVDALVERSRWWFARYTIDRLWWSLSGERAYEISRVLDDLHRTLDALGL